MTANNRNIHRTHSLSTRLLVSVILWVVCALIFTGYTLGLLWQLENGGVAINDAGSLRMRVFYMTTLVSQRQREDSLRQVQSDFTRILDNLKQQNANTFSFSDSRNILQRIDFIETHWENIILPLIATHSRTGATVPPDDLTILEQFVKDIDGLVKQIEERNTRHISKLRSMQCILVIMVFFSAFTTMYLLYRTVIRPLRTLQEGISELGRGNLTKRIVIASHDEFGTVSLGFNRMAANLEDFYTNLEYRVSEKTAALKEKNHELSALYDTTAFLNEAHTQEIMTKRFLANVMALSHADAGSIMLTEDSAASSGLVTHIGLDNDGDSRIGEDFIHRSTFHIQHAGNDFGTMTLYFKHTAPHVTSQTEYLIETLTNQLAVALENQQLALSDRQLAVMRERNLIARGLHDSIAQSLSFLNLQTQMLQTALKNNEDDKVSKTLAFIQQGVQECYEDVRELLLNFRVRISETDFDEVVHNLLECFKQQTRVNIELTRTGEMVAPDSQQQLQVIFILQEALSNIRKHARASEVRIHFAGNDRQFVMTITDNGKGFDRKSIEKNTRHVGLSIMAERAAQIAAVVDVTSTPAQGTTVTLTIPGK